MAESSVSSLRHEFPALALAIAFIPRRSRLVYADLFLLWMEARRAAYANEAMIAAVRIAWWRDAIINQQSQSVPLADRLLVLGKSHPDMLASITDALDQMISLLAGGAAKSDALAIWNKTIAKQIIIWSQDNPQLSIVHDQASQILHALDQNLLGHTEQPMPAYSGKDMVFRLIIWLTQDPTRLYYPDQQPLLALKMSMAVMLRRI
ncbi:MAG: hypothetical protein HOI92_09125 [Alphaproteobacteria bacterium]|jgi:hypothetical protein|nr:hypothetical protein [Alphaproteobacteria bacterium]